ncbi:SRPBCC family protein [Terricaulis sp.]|uniref:SRPBCC family protein n=1 Tax=Terricaulis sp. TaxID=2768686 RepID=UPI002AC5BD0B|nr:SRPBCC family protein [Terricaulis sp.]MDZ4692141.1 SRPBCC family protein [Terricaulis sp.]
MPKPAEASLPNDRDVRVVRSFDAPRELVWDAHAKPELVQKWCLGPPGWSMPVCEMDVRVGGAYRWRWRNDADGAEFGFFGTFTEVNRPEKLAHEESYDPGDVGGAMPSDEPALVTNDFSEKDGVTTMVVTIRFPSKEARDGAFSTGMTDGMEMGYVRLDEIFKG